MEKFQLNNPPKKYSIKSNHKFNNPFKKKLGPSLTS